MSDKRLSHDHYDRITIDDEAELMRLVAVEAIRIAEEKCPPTPDALARARKAIADAIKSLPEAPAPSRDVFAAMMGLKTEGLSHFAHLLALGLSQCLPVGGFADHGSAESTEVWRSELHVSEDKKLKGQWFVQRHGPIVLKIEADPELEGRLVKYCLTVPNQLRAVTGEARIRQLPDGTIGIEETIAGCPPLDPRDDAVLMYAVIQEG